LFFGEKLKELRLRFNMGSKFFAKSINMKPKTYFQLEHCYINPINNRKWFNKIIKILRVTDLREIKELETLWKKNNIK
jgi:DNA-binding XRE family transcriptional regulator